ncbi:hypothetical protein [Pseudodesulfovibrio sp. zrk46]|uniref:hypothetical protein n=1 Tax=Pseudodesulfovibrio sp. zrk46 TaxID=2725288 RepID=UPI0014491EE1|nr:hypothetical protein [Pseudodesulfovibrio sp. zrk46]QJB55646.1 hypothetical protein HFN16_04195 [Pseudodesulfovibrio sp. zrk46]
MKKHLFLALICMAVITLSSTARASSLHELEILDSEPFSLTDTTRWLAEYAPDILEDLEEIGKIDNRLYEEIYLIAAEEVAIAEQVRDLDPDAFKDFLETAHMEVRTELTALRYQQATSTKEKKRLKAELAELTEKVFDARMNEHTAMIKDIEAELEELKRTRDNRAKHRDRIIERRIDDLTSPSYPDLEWW